jgi:hypothetical protein
VAPFAVLLFILKNNIRPHYASLDLLPVFAGCWAIFAVWITLHKGMGSLAVCEGASAFALSMFVLTAAPVPCGHTDSGPKECSPR